MTLAPRIALVVSLFSLFSCTHEPPKPPVATGVTGADVRPGALRGLRYC